MKTLRELSHFLNLYFICSTLTLLGPLCSSSWVAGAAGSGGLDLKNLSAHSAQHSSARGEHASWQPAANRKDTAVGQDKSLALDGRRQTPRGQQRPKIVDDDDDDVDVRFGSVPRPRTTFNPSHREREGWWQTHATSPRPGGRAVVDKSENNHPEMKLSRRHRPGAGWDGWDARLNDGKDRADVDDDGDDDVVDAAKDDYYDRPSEGGASEGDNYEDDKIINSGSLDNFFDMKSSSSSSSSVSSSLPGAAGVVSEHRRGDFKNGASTLGHSAKDSQDSGDADEEDDDDDEDEEEDDDEREEDYGETSYGEDILPPSEAFGSFGGRTGDGLKVEEAPYFLVEPQSTHVIRSKPAVLKCKAANTLQIHFKCSGSIKPPPSIEESHVDPHSGVHFQEVTATISRDLVFEYFGKQPFKCECHAWSPRGKAVSQPASIVVA
uniref:Netrin receptor UNC5A-D-like N-terminal domain-containing protein n=1 Tax=Anopheles atroparvus TaxID=41427 RepID=A0AAG5CV29_ANOAO